MRTCIVFNAGGASMSGVARLLCNSGWRVIGHEREPNFRTDALASSGIDVKFGGDLDISFDAVQFGVYSSVEDPGELRARFRLPDAVVLHSQFALIDSLSFGSISVAVAGSFGKTITTAITVAALDAAGLKASFTCGGEVISESSNSRVGSSPIWVIEAVETHGNLLHLRPALSLILNIESHSLLPLFASFVRNTTGVTILNADDPVCRKLLDLFSGSPSVLRMSFDDPSADYRATQLACPHGRISFALSFRDVNIGSIQSQLLTTFSPYNVLGAAAIAHQLKASHEDIVSGCSSFAGVRNRFEVRFRMGTTSVIADIAHHPASIRASLELARTHLARRVVVIYRPHMYAELDEEGSATKAALEVADRVILRDVLSFKDRLQGGPTSREFVRRCGDPAKWAYAEINPQLSIQAEALDDTAVIIMGMYQDDLLIRAVCSMVTSRCAGPNSNGGHP